MEVFLDASVIIAGCHSRSGASAVILGLIRSGELTGHTSTVILNESQRNLLRRFPKTTVTNFYRVLRDCPLIIHPAPTRAGTDRFVSIINSKDAHVLAAAEAAHTDCLVTLDRKDFKQPRVLQRVSFQILTPGELLQKLRNNESTLLLD